MAKTYRLTPARRTADSVLRTMTRLGIGAQYRQLLRVRGRNGSELRTTSVDVMDVGGNQWLVAPFGVSDWVRDTRASDEVTLSRRGYTESFHAEEVSGTMAVAVLRTYISMVRINRPYFDATAEATEGDLLAELPGHPVFRLTPAAALH